MGPLLIAVCAKWDATAALVAAFPGGLHQGRADENRPAGDYALYHVIDAPSNQVWAAVDPYDAEIQLDGFFADPAEAAEKMKLMKVFGTAAMLGSLGAGGGTIRNVRRLGEPMPLDDLSEGDAEGRRNLKHWSVSFSFHVDI